MNCLLFPALSRFILFCLFDPLDISLPIWRRHLSKGDPCVCILEQCSLKVRWDTNNNSRSILVLSLNSFLTTMNTLPSPAGIRDELNGSPSIIPLTRILALSLARFASSLVIGAKVQVPTPCGRTSFDLKVSSVISSISDYQRWMTLPSMVL